MFNILKIENATMKVCIYESVLLHDQCEVFLYR